MKRYVRYACLSLLFSLIGCGTPGTKTNGVPQPPNPLGGGTTDLNPGTTTQNPEIPALYYKGVAIKLADYLNYSGLKDLAGTVVVPVVGDPKVAMSLTIDRNAGVSGQILVAFEDKLGFWGALVNTFAGTSTYDGLSLDLIFSDDDVVLRTMGTLSGDSLNATLYYRIRQTGEDQCKPVTVTCVGGTTGCGSLPVYDPVPDCKAYITPGNGVVKQLGTFTNPAFSNWVN